VGDRHPAVRGGGDGEAVQPPDGGTGGLVDPTARVALPVAGGVVAPQVDRVSPALSVHDERRVQALPADVQRLHHGRVAGMATPLDREQPFDVRADRIPAQRARGAAAPYDEP
jgi:hypothetical protein